MKSTHCRLFCLFVVLNLLQISTSGLYDFYPFRKSNCKTFSGAPPLDPAGGLQRPQTPSCVRLNSLAFSHFVHRTTHKPYHTKKQCGVPARPNLCFIPRLIGLFVANITHRLYIFIFRFLSNIQVDS